MNDHELLDQIDELLGEAKKQIYRRAGRFAAMNQAEVANMSPDDPALAKALIVVTIPQCYAPLGAKQKELLQRLQRNP
jgi:hypothetical protein